MFASADGSTPGEAVLYRARRHWSAWGLPLAMALVVPCFITWMFLEGMFPWPLGLVLAVFFPIAAGCVGLGVVLYKFTEVGLTGRRITIRKPGVPRLVRRSILLEEVDDISVVQKDLIGKIVVRRSDGGRYSCSGIHQPARFQLIAWAEVRRRKAELGIETPPFPKGWDRAVTFRQVFTAYLLLLVWVLLVLRGVR